MHKFLRTFFLAFALASASFAQAQTEFVEGFVVQASGDTLKGFVGNRSYLLNGRMCLFKPTQNATITEYSAAKIAGYGFADGSRFYESRLLDLAADSGYFFLNTLVKGKASVYMFRDKNSTDHYIMLKSNGEMPELVNTDTTITDKFNGTRRRMQNEEFKKQMAFEFTDCPAMMVQLEQSKLIYRDLLKIFTKYNQCAAPEQLVYIKPRVRSNAVFGFVLAPGISALKVKGEHFFAAADHGAKAMVSGGVFLNVSLPRISERISVQPELLFTSTTYKDDFTVKEGSRIKDYEVELGLRYIKFPVSVKYTFPGTKNMPYVRAGVSTAFLVSSKNNMNLETNFFGIKKSDSGKVLNDLRGLEQGYFGGIGLSTANNKLFMEFRYEKTNGFSPYGDLSTNLANYLFMIGIGL